jgi:hypothetical protein
MQGLVGGGHVPPQSTQVPPMQLPPVHAMPSGWFPYVHVMPPAQPVLARHSLVGGGHVPPQGTQSWVDVHTPRTPAFVQGAPVDLGV